MEAEELVGVEHGHVAFGGELGGGPDEGCVGDLGGGRAEGVGGGADELDDLFDEDGVASVVGDADDDRGGELEGGGGESEAEVGGDHGEVLPAQVEHAEHRGGRAWEGEEVREAVHFLDAGEGVVAAGDPGDHQVEGALLRERARGGGLRRVHPWHACWSPRRASTSWLTSLLWKALSAPISDSAWRRRSSGSPE